MKRHIKNLTYRNLMRVAKMIEQKGYTAEESIVLAKRKFAEFNPKGMPIEGMVKMMLTAEEYEKQNGHKFSTI